MKAPGWRLQHVPLPQRAQGLDIGESGGVQVRYQDGATHAVPAEGTHTMVRASNTEARTWWEDAKWADNHASQILAKYEGDWIAVVGGRVVTSGGDPVSVREQASRATGKTAEEVYVEFVDSADTIYGANWA